MPAKFLAENADDQERTARESMRRMGLLSNSNTPRSALNAGYPNASAL
jgi:hypothetical protein